MPKEKRVSAEEGFREIEVGLFRASDVAAKEAERHHADKADFASARAEGRAYAYVAAANAIRTALLQATPPDGRVGELRAEIEQGIEFWRAEVEKAKEAEKDKRGPDPAATKSMAIRSQEVCGRMAGWLEMHVLPLLPSTQPSDGRISVELTEEEKKALRHEFAEPYGHDIRTCIFEKLRAALAQYPHGGGK